MWNHRVLSWQLSGFPRDDVSILHGSFVGLFKHSMKELISIPGGRVARMDYRASLPDPPRNPSTQFRR